MACPVPIKPSFIVMMVILAMGMPAAFAQSASETNGALLAQNSTIEQARLFARPAGTETTGITADGTPLPDAEGNSGDDSFGAQQILKTQASRVPEFSATGDASMFYTNNVALTRRDTIDDGLFVANAALSWNHVVNQELQVQAGIHVSIFRYVDTSALDFENLGAGLGVAWAPHNSWGISTFARYDFSELLDRHSREILEDHEFTLGAQKAWVFNRTHALTVGVLGSVGISDPYAAQRDQVGGFVGYHVALTRQLDADFSYRLSGFFYNTGGRDDLNQAITAGVRYHLTRWMDAGALFSYGFNRSSRSVFDYDVVNTGGVASLTIRF
jgi:hypothetical protein